MPELTNNKSALPAEYAVLQKIRDMWANRVPDDEIRDILNLTKEEWKSLMKILKELNETEADNRIAYEKFAARTYKRSKELERMRLYAEGMDELGTAVKCFQLEADGDKAMVEMGQKLGILQGEIIKVDGTISHDHRLTAILAHLSIDKQKEAKEEMAQLSQLLIGEGIVISNDPGKGEGDKG